MELTVMDDDATDDDQHDKTALYLIPHFWREDVHKCCYLVHLGTAIHKLVHGGKW